MYGHQAGKFLSSEGFFGDKNTTLDRIQTELDVIGWIPGIGDVADGANGLISLYRKDYVSAGLDFISMVPLAGDLIGKGGKTVNRIIKHADDIAEVTRIADKIGDVTSSADKISDTTKVVDKIKPLHRPYIRKSTREAVENVAQKNTKGQFIDVNTGEVITGKYDLGHKRGHEFRTERAKAQREGLIQSQFNDRMNNPDLYQIESPSSNRSHKFEAPRE